MKYDSTCEAVFLSRPNRFIALVSLDGAEERVHVKNTGRLRELLIPGARVILQKGSGAARKTAYDLISVYKEGLGWVNIDAQTTNAAVLEWLRTDPPQFPSISKIKPEFTFGASRVDFYLECGSREILMEVKGCTLERNGVGLFPDAPTERGVKHLRELSAAVSQGYECYLAYVIAMPGVTRVIPNEATHPAYAAAFREAEAAGVYTLYLACDITPDSITIKNDPKA